MATELERPTDMPHAITPTVPVLTAEHIAPNARLYADRGRLLDDLPHGGIVAEVGTWEGAWAHCILKQIEPEELHLFEFYPERITNESVTQDARVTIHGGDSSTMLAQMPDDYFDWLYIDADHSFEGVQKDVTQAKVKVKPGGLLALNDYTLWSMLQMKPYGVVQNVNHLCVEEGFVVVAFAFQSQGYPDIVIRRPW